MEMELGLKLTRPDDEFSSTESQFAKDRSGPLFQSTETDNMFILTVHLKGYMQKNIKIDINEEGTIIAIRGEKPVQETVMVGWKLVKKDVEIRKFRKAFKIPDGVILDKIKARFDEEKSTLTVKMPKKVKGILGIGIEEVKEHENLPIVADNKIPKRVTFKEEENQEKRKEIMQKSLEEKGLKDHQVCQERDMQLPVSTSSIQKPHEEVERTVVKDIDTVQEIRKSPRNHVDNKPESTSSRDKPNVDQANERENELLEDEVGEISRKKEDDNIPKRGSKICVPIVAAGSAILLSLVVFVIHFIRTKNQSGRRKD